MKQCRKISIVLIGLFESLFFSGCLFGWTSLLHVLQQEGVYSHICSFASQQRNFSSDVFGQSENFSISGNKFSTSTTTTTGIVLGNAEDKEVVMDILNSNLKDSYTKQATTNLEYEKNIREKFERCSEQDREFGLIFTVAGIMYTLTSVLIGFSLDYFGLWITRFLACLLTTSGFVFLAFTSREMPWLLWPALILISLGTNQTRLSSLQLADLFPSQRSTILIGYSSGYACSSLLFLLIQYLYYAGVNYRLIVLLLSFLSVLTFPATFLMPRMRIVEEIKEENDNEDIKENLNRDENFPSKEEGEKELKLNRREVPLQDSLFTISAFLHLYWQFVTCFIIFNYAGSFNAWAYMTTDSVEEVASYNKFSGLCQIIVPIFIPLSGFFTDFLTKRAAKESDKTIKQAKKFEAPSYVILGTTLLILALSACTLTLEKWGIYVSLVLLAISRPLVIGCITSYNRIRFNPGHFNRLNGIFGTVTAIMSFIQYPIFVWMFSSESGFVQSHWLLLSMILVSFSSPVHMMIRSWSLKFAKEYLIQIED